MLVRKEKTHSILWYSSAQHSTAKRRILRRSPPSPPNRPAPLARVQIQFFSLQGQAKAGQARFSQWPLFLDWPLTITLTHERLWLAVLWNTVWRVHAGFTQTDLFCVPWPDLLTQ